MFKVQVVGVNVLMMPSRQRRWGRIMGRKAAWKKAIVTLRAGQIVYDPSGLSMPEWEHAPQSYWELHQ